MARKPRQLPTELQAAATSIFDYFENRLTTQDAKIKEQDAIISDLQANAQLSGDVRVSGYDGLKDTIEGLQGQLDQFDTVLNSLLTDFGSAQDDIKSLQGNVHLLDARVNRRASKTELATTHADVDELKTDYLGLPVQMKEMTRILRAVQEQVTKLQAAVYHDPSSDVPITDLQLSDALDLFETADEGENPLSLLESAHGSSKPMSEISLAKTKGSTSTGMKQSNFKPLLRPVVEVTPQKSSSRLNFKSKAVAAHKKAAASRAPISSTPVPSGLRRSFSPTSDAESEATLMPSASEFSRLPTQPPTPWTSFARSADLTDLTPRVASSVTDSDDDDDALEENKEERRLGGTGPPAYGASAEVQGHSDLDTNGDTRHDTLDENLPVLPMESAMYKDKWISEGKLCTLDDYVRKNRVPTQGGRRMRALAPINYKQKAPPKLNSKRSPAKRTPKKSQPQAQPGAEAETDGPPAKKQRQVDDLLQTFGAASQKYPIGSAVS